MAAQFRSMSNTLEFACISASFTVITSSLRGRRPTLDVVSFSVSAAANADPAHLHRTVLGGTDCPARGVVTAFHSGALR
jgi:hypothetical protein